MNNFCLSHGGQLPYTIEVECSILKAQPFLKMKPLAPLSIFRCSEVLCQRYCFQKGEVYSIFDMDRGIAVGSSTVRIWESIL